jgi:hypothetical protein
MYACDHFKPTFSNIGPLGLHEGLQPAALEACLKIVCPAGQTAFLDCKGVAVCVNIVGVVVVVVVVGVVVSVVVGVAMA